MKNIIFIVFVSTITSSCLSMHLSPFARSVKVETEPSQADVEIIQRGRTIKKLTTPGRFTLYETDDIQIIIHKDGYKSTMEELRFVTDGPRVVSSALMGFYCLLWPVGIDAITNVWKVPEKKVISVNLKPESDYEDSQPETLRIEYDREERIITFD